MKGFLKYHIYDRLVLFKKTLQLRFWKKNKPIVVHTMAKVGSLSVYSSLKKQLPKTPLFHTHSLDIDEVQKNIDLCFKNGIYPGSRSPAFLVQNQIISTGRPYKIITLYRDPIERNISAFFDAFKLYVGVKPEDYTGDMKTLEKLFHTHIPYKYPLQWFDEYLLKETRIDVYNFPFDAALGYLTIRDEPIEILIMNCYLEDNLKEKLISEFSALPNFKLENTNITAERKSGDLYRAFKNYIRFSESYLNAYYNSKYAKHFFTSTQRKKAIEKWLKI